MSKAKIIVEDLIVRFGGVNIVDDISLELQPGEMVGLVGESGSGKTITGKAIAGLLPEGFQISAKTFTLGSTDLRKSVGKRKRDTPSVSMIFQNPFTALDPNFTIGSFLVEIIKKNRKISRKKSFEEAVTLLETVQISDPRERMKSYPHQLSGGQQQRVMIAIALAMEADFIVADEATTALDVTVQAEVVCVLDEIRKTKNVGVLFISHDLALVKDLSDRFYVMQKGRIIETGDSITGFQGLKHPYSLQLIKSLPQLNSVNIL